MKNRRMGFVVPPLLLVITLLVVGGGVYLYKNKLPGKTDSQLVPVRVSVSGMNEAIFSLLGNVTVLGQKYLYIRNRGYDGYNLISQIDPDVGNNMGDSCGDTIQAVFEITNPKVDPKHTTFQGNQTVDVDVLKVVSHDKPQRVCVEFDEITGPATLVLGQTGTWKLPTRDGTRWAVVWSDGTPAKFMAGESGIPADSEFSTTTSLFHRFTKIGDYHPQFFSKYLNYSTNNAVSEEVLTVKVLPAGL